MEKQLKKSSNVTFMVGNEISTLGDIGVPLNSSNSSLSESLLGSHVWEK